MRGRCGRSRRVEFLGKWRWTLENSRDRGEGDEEEDSNAMNHCVRDKTIRAAKFRRCCNIIYY